MADLEKSWMQVGYAVNDMDNAISEICHDDPIAYLDVEEILGKVISPIARHEKDE